MTLQKYKDQKISEILINKISYDKIDICSQKSNKKQFKNFTDFFQYIIKYNFNKLRFLKLGGKHKNPNFQNKIYPYDNDKSVDPLFNLFDDITCTNKNIFKTMKDFLSIYSYFIIETGYNECITDFKLDVFKNFIYSILNSHLIIIGYNNYFADKYKPKEFVKYFIKIFFSTHNRHSNNDTSLFEHYFVGELNIKSNNFVGLHYWLSFFYLESRGKLNYYGYTKKGKNIINAKFNYMNILKITSFMYPTFPEFEMLMLLLVMDKKESIRFRIKETIIEYKLIKQDGKQLYPIIYPHIVENYKYQKS